MTDGPTVRFDRFTLIACAPGALLSAGLTFGAVDLNAGIPVPVVAILFALGLVPYGLTAVMNAIRPFRRLVVATTRAVAVVYGVLDCGIRYLALYHPTGSTDSVVVLVLPFWWVPLLLVVAALTAAVQWVLPEPVGPVSTPSRV